MSRIVSSLTPEDEKYVRFPMVPLLNTPLEYRGLQQLTTYYGKLGGGNSVFQYDLLPGRSGGLT